MLAGLILLVALWLLIGPILHILAFLLSAIVLVVAVVAVIWAVRVLL